MISKGVPYALLASAAGLALRTAVAATNDSYLALNVIPYSPGDETRSAAEALKYVERTGDELVLYSLTLHPEGRPATAKMKRCIESYRAFADALSGTKAKPGILIQSVLGHWPRVDRDEEPWTRSVNVKGEKVRYCPDDPAFKAYVFSLAQEVARAKPFFVLTDDDLRAYSHDAECFCPRHVADLNRRLGTAYDESGARAAVTACKVGDRTHEAFIAMQRDMIEGVARTIRAGFDTVDPSLRCGSSMPAEEPRWAARTAKILAAKGQVPVVRVCNAAYLEGAPKQMYGNVMATFAKCALCGPDVRVIEEADTFPQNLWSKSAVSFYSKSVIGVMCGLTGAKRWYVGTHAPDGMPVDGGYAAVLERHRGQLPSLSAAVSGSCPDGVAIPLSRRFQAWHPVLNKSELGYSGLSAAECWLGPYGIPFYATESLTNDTVYALAGAAQVGRFSDAELNRLLSGRLWIDGKATEALCRRGFAGLVGVKCESRDVRYNGEQSAEGRSLRLSPTPGTPILSALPDARVLSHLTYRPYAGAQPECVAVGAAYFRNRLGGQVVANAFHADVPCYQQLNEARKSFLLQQLSLLRLGCACVEDNQHVLVLLRRTEDRERILSVTNLGYDSLDCARIRLADGERISECLDDKGQWVPFEDHRLAVHETAVLRIVRQGCPKILSRTALRRNHPASIRHFETEKGSLAQHWKGVHVQGFACAPDAIYLGVDRSGIFKFSWGGRLIKHVDAPNHTGDIVWYDGKLYTSVDVLEGPWPSRSGIVQVYDGDLNLVKEAHIEQGIDGICAKDCMLYLGMNNAEKRHRVNQIGRMDAETLEFIDRINIDHGYATSWGTQNLTTDGNCFWVQFYSDMPLAVFDADWRLVRALPFRSNQGFDCIPHEFWRDEAHPRFASGRNILRGEEPAYCIDFYEFDGRQMVNVTAADEE